MTRTLIDSEGAIESTGRWRMPAEWSRQAAVWVSWPHNQETWPKNLAAAQAEFATLVSTIAESQLVRVLVPTDQQAQAQNILGQHSQIELLPVATNDAWIRDYGPTFVVDSDSNQLGAVNWQYNAWGGKYPPFDADQAVTAHIASLTKATLVHSPLCLEGGAVEINENGLLLTTRSCALDPNRNPDWSTEQIESELKRCLGAEQVIWLDGNAIEGDDTDGHIDQLARFVSNDEIVYAWTDDSADTQFSPLSKNLETLKQQLDQCNRNIRLTALPVPQPMVWHGNRIPASYCNFLILNDTVIVPQFGAPNDSAALELLSDRFADRRVLGLNSLELAVGLGSFHCLSQQQPATPH